MLMAVQPSNNNFRAVSISLHKDLVERLRKRVPRYGDRSKVVQLLLEHFLDGKIILKVPERKL